jgi:hypothetical protein
MFRPIPSVAALMAATALATPVLAEDDFASFRDPYPTQPSQWAGLGDENDSVKLEFGVRYWYSIGGHDFTTGGGNFASTDTAHNGELHLRIEDHYTNTYAKAIAGYSALISGTYNDPNNPPDSAISSGHVGYIGADVGWNTFGRDDGNGIGPIVGYLYWNDSPNTDSAAYTTNESASGITYDAATGVIDLNSLGYASSENNMDVHSLRLGMQGKVTFGDFFDIDAEGVAVPFAKVDGIIGSDQVALGPPTPFGNPSYIQASPVTYDGWGYGAMGQIMFGVHPSENLTFRIGGRAWYLQGVGDAHYTRANLGDPQDLLDPDPPLYDSPVGFSLQDMVEHGMPFKLFRYGLLAEATYRF